MGGLPICNLIMITPSHVAFVPNFKNAKELIYHLSNGTCICKKAKPCRMILEKDSFINDSNLLDEMQHDLTVVADTECLVQDLVGTNDGDNEDLIEGFSNIIL